MYKPCNRVFLAPNFVSEPFCQWPPPRNKQNVLDCKRWMCRYVQTRLHLTFDLDTRSIHLLAYCSLLVFFLWWFYSSVVASRWDLIEWNFLRFWLLFKVFLFNLLNSNFSCMRPLLQIGFNLVLQEAQHEDHLWKMK